VNLNTTGNSRFKKDCDLNFDTRRLTRNSTAQPPRRFQADFPVAAMRFGS